MEKLYDTIILGAGPAGMTAAIYCKRAGMSVLVIEKSVPGGAVAITSEVANYPGFKSIGGTQLSDLMFEHMKALGADVVFDEVISTNLTAQIKTVKCANGTYQGKTVIIGIGAAARRLNLDNEKQFLGKGISYCATCDGNFFKGKDVAVVGGGNSALEDAIYLSNLAKTVYLIHRRDEFRGDAILVETMDKTKNVKPVLMSIVSKISGNNKIESITVSNLCSKEHKELKVDGVFVAIGRGPDTEIIDKEVVRDKGGYIVTDEKMRTNIEGVYAAGDIRNTPLRQIVTATGDGAIAATTAYGYIKLQITNYK